MEGDRKRREREREDETAIFYTLYDFHNSICFLLVSLQLRNLYPGFYFHGFVEVKFVELMRSLYPGFYFHIVLSKFVELMRSRFVNIGQPANWHLRVNPSAIPVRWLVSGG